MRFNPIMAAQNINQSYRDYMKSTFYIGDEDFREAYFAALDKLDFANGPYLECVDAFAQGNSLEQLVKEGLLSHSFEKLFAKDPRQYKRALYKHQENALRVALADKNMVVTTGTGSGKTECFLYPILNHLLEEERAGTLSPGVRVLLLYPMNALANDQMQRLRELLQSYPTITFGSYTGETAQRRNDAVSHYRKLHQGEDPLPNELVCREDMKLNPPHILVTNYAMLEYLLIRPDDNVFFDEPNAATHWKYIVLDEAHVYSGASGMEVAILLRRLIHRLQDNEKIRYILTSATLGDTSKNKQILNFAHSLCAGKDFSADSIIRAVRKVANSTIGYSGEEPLYQRVSDLISEDRVQLNPDSPECKKALLTILNAFPIVKDWTNEELPFQQILYEVFSRDALYVHVRKKLANGAMSVQTLVDSCTITENGLLNFIQIASFAIKDGGKLLDARYHHFIRTLEGAYVSFYPKKTLSLVPRKTYLSDGKEYRCFKLSVCQFCGELYLEGFIKDHTFSQEDGEAKQYFMVIQPEFLEYSDDDDLGNIDVQSKKQKNAYKLCTSCGRTSKCHERITCACDVASHILLYLVPRNSEDGVLHSCSHCKTTNPKSSILRGFYLGQDASTAVVGESLFEEIPETYTKTPKRLKQSSNPFAKKVVEPESKKTRRLLLFSDSRQEAAYFASYFQYTYDVIYRRRIMMKAARVLLASHPDSYGKGIPIIDLAIEMEAILSSLQTAALGPAVIRREVWKTIIAEFKNFSRNNLNSIGWLEYRLHDSALAPGEIPLGDTTLSYDEMNTLAQFYLEYCVRHGAIKLPPDVPMNSEDWGYFDFGKREPFLQRESSGVNSKQNNSKAFIPMTHNALTEYMKRVFPESLSEHKDFLRMVFDDYFCDEAYRILVLGSGRQSLFKINPEKMVVLVQGFHTINHYRCDICGQLTSINMHNACPSYRCSGTLHPFDFKSSDTKDYFINQYGVDAPLIPIAIKEHTAQLSKETAQEYQQKFINGDINILSCSTTFEMGVDVGDLQTVFMKNVPPRPSNYIQRAGRAGRRLNSVAFSLTFCKLGPHDFYYYQNPKEMINGKISPPTFKVDNPKIVMRHVFAVLLSEYWRELFPSATQIQDFFSDSISETIMQYLDHIPSKVLDYLERVVPKTLQGEIGEFIYEYRKNILPKAKEMYVSDVREYEFAYETEDAKSDKNHRLLGWLQGVKKTHQEESVLSFYSKNNLIPKYGFPVDTVTLFTDASSKSYSDTNSKLSLQRDLIQAISDYAPDSEVIADGYMYTSRYIRKLTRNDNLWKQSLVQQCENKYCGKLTVSVFTGEEPKGKTLCHACGLPLVSSKVMIIPENGFIIEPEVEKVTTKKPKKTPRTEFYYLGLLKQYSINTAKSYTLNLTKVSVISSPDDKLLVMNKSDFLVCQTCGYSKISTGKPFASTAHKTPRGTDCPSKSLIKRHLGHVFKTDVALLTLNRQLESNEAITILYSLLEGLSKYFDIDRDDIDGCISYQSYVSEGAELGTTFVLFDSVPGGAGNVRRIFDADKNDFFGFLRCSLDRVRKCNCGTDGDMVCYSCLCNFKNQHYQEKMQRRYAISFLEALLE